jgi:hypothetical protein
MKQFAVDIGSGREDLLIEIINDLCVPLTT